MEIFEIKGLVNVITIKYFFSLSQTAEVIKSRPLLLLLFLLLLLLLLKVISMSNIGLELTTLTSSCMFHQLAKPGAPDLCFLMDASLCEF